MTEESVPAFSLRLAMPADAEAVAEVQTATWKVAYAGLMPAEFLASISASERVPVWRKGLEEGRYRILLAENTGSVIGFSAFARSRDADAAAHAVGEVSALYVSERFWGVGAGRALLRESEIALRGAGFDALTLWVLTTNVRGRAFYERQGYRLDGAEKLETLPSKITIQEVRYRKELI